MRDRQPITGEQNLRSGNNSLGERAVTVGEGHRRL